MATKPDELFQSALDEKQRAELAALLIESLDDADGQGVESAWRTEIERRMKELDSGSDEAVAWSEARARLHSGLDGRARDPAASGGGWRG
jgi:putative addiction module component (TIGR02574 family)